MTGRLDPDAHRARAERHANVADALRSAAGEEWSAVCYFYAAYHLMKAAIIEDSVFDSHDACQALHSDLFPDDRHTDRHQGRRQRSGAREWGVNDLVLLLFGAAASKPYERLHQASIDVRYKDGLRPGVRLDEIAALYGTIAELSAAGRLASSVDPS